MHRYPLIGFGLDAQYSSRYPYGMSGLCYAYQSRLSHVSVVSLRDPIQALWFREECARGLPIIHHLSGVAPADPTGPHLGRLAELDLISNVLCPIWTCEDVGIWSIGPYAIPYFAPPVFEEEMADLIADRICKILDASPYGYSAELPACPFIIGEMPLGAFFQRLIERSGCKMILDVSHVYSYAIARQENPFSVLTSLPLSSVCEMHIAGGVVSQDHPARYLDTHSHPILEEIIELASIAVGLCEELQCITYEIGVGLTQEIIELDVSRLEATLANAGFQPFTRVAGALVHDPTLS